MNKREFIRTAGLLGAGIVLSPLVACSGEKQSDRANPEPPTPGGADGPFTLPALGYAFNALEPAIDAQTMEIHHGKHHATYVAKLNEAVASSDKYAGMDIEALLANCHSADTAIRNNGGGHWNHSMFWKWISPGGNHEPQGKLREAINSAFGSLEVLKNEFSEAAKSRFGSGWAWLISDNSGKLSITSTPNQDNPMMTLISEQKGRPILGIDVWEHAYYLKYQNRRPEYVSAFFDIVNWDSVSEQYQVR